MAMSTITVEDITSRLGSLGYTILKEPEDTNLIQFSIDLAMDQVSMFLNMDSYYFEEIMRRSIIDIICANFLSAKRNIGIDSSGEIVGTGDVKSIKEDTLSIEYDVGSSSTKSSASPLDEMLDFLSKNAYQFLTRFRRIYFKKRPEVL